MEMQLWLNQKEEGGSYRFQAILQMKHLHKVTYLSLSDL